MIIDSLSEQIKQINERIDELKLEQYRLRNELLKVIKLFSCGLFIFIWVIGLILLLR